jgi:hypothetical protein
MFISLSLHYWIGSINNPKGFYPYHHHKFSIVTDTIRIVRELKNEIPDRSWMLYLLELFNVENIPLELNLISQFDNQNYFEAIFGGYNKYRYTKVLPEVGYQYLRQIRLDRLTSTVEYYLKNLDTKVVEVFAMSMQNQKPFSFQISSCFSGIEWWNKMENRPYPIRYVIEVSNLMYGYNDDPYDSKSVVFFPVTSLTSNKDNRFTQNTHAYYPVTFIDNGTKDGCICYSVDNGHCVSGLNAKVI